MFDLHKFMFLSHCNSTFYAEKSVKPKDHRHREFAAQNSLLFRLCVMLALIFCSFGGYWYRRHFQHRLLASQHASGHRTMMMFMMNNIHTNNHYDYGGSGIEYMKSVFFENDIYCL